MYAMDALFGLPKKKSAGESYRSSLHGELFFIEQTDVDLFVSESQKPKRNYVSAVTHMKHLLYFISTMYILNS